MTDTPMSSAPAGNPNAGAGNTHSDGGLEAALGAVLNKHLSKGNAQFRARLLNQMVQLARHGNFAETFIRTTPEGTDMVNFARMWEYVLVQADRQTRGYVAKTNRNEFEQTRKDFEDCVDFMVSKLRSASVRHKLDLSGTNFISRVAQRYGISDKVRKGPAQPQADAPAQAATQAPAPQAAAPVQQAAAPADAAEAAKPARVAKPKAVEAVAMPDVDDM
ncbi:MAG: hypothetical protein EON60_00955 [Alphaproteobacteria bacterium]|nr:MAG: hypothetical protein EON60_00955 [Alphaproteobacteria bacterium]